MWTGWSITLKADVDWMEHNTDNWRTGTAWNTTLTNWHKLSGTWHQLSMMQTFWNITLTADVGLSGTKHWQRILDSLKHCTNSWCCTVERGDCVTRTDLGRGERGRSSFPPPPGINTTGIPKFWQMSITRSYSMLLNVTPFLFKTCKFYLQVLKFIPPFGQH